MTARQNDTAEQAAQPDAARRYVDTHVHLHAVFDVVRFFDAAAAHFAAAGAGGHDGVLCLAEVAGAGAFERLRERGQAGPWRFVPRGRCGLVAERGDGVGVGVVAGRQVRCDNGLEVLGIGEPLDDVADGRGFEATVASVRERGALTVVPYGVGKWTGKRGAQVRRLIEAGPKDVAYGDNGGRVGWGETALLKRARAHGRTVLVGTDPLAQGRGEARAGSWGVVTPVVDGHGADDGWAERVVAALRGVGPAGETFGRRLGAVAGVVQQIGARL
ncbi:MAG: hypothetical protein AAGG38_00915 [Planctomycetota bacterium]